MNKNKKWKYITLILLTVGILFFAIFAMGTSRAEINYIHSPKNNQKIDYLLSNEAKSKLIPKTRFTELTNNQIDQKQIEIGNSPDSFGLSKESFVSVIQSFKNNREPMYGFTVSVKEYSSNGNGAKEPLYLGILDSKLVGDDLFNLDNWEIVYRLNPGDLPKYNTLYWISAEFDEPINVPSDSTYYIGFITVEQSVIDGGWCVGQSGDKGDVYSRGTSFTTIEGNSWKNEQTDLGFVTYTTEESPEPDPEQKPVIEIHITTWTDTAFTVSLSSLFMAAVTGSKFFGLF